MKSGLFSLSSSASRASVNVPPKRNTPRSPCTVGRTSTCVRLTDSNSARWLGRVHSTRRPAGAISRKKVTVDQGTRVVTARAARTFRGEMSGSLTRMLSSAMKPWINGRWIRLAEP